MTTILFVGLILSQLLTFYFLLVLNSKLSNYKIVEQKQEAIIREMDDAISAYLVELKDENDRLVEKLMAVSEKKKNVVQSKMVSNLRQTSDEDANALSSKHTMEIVEESSEPLTRNKVEKDSVASIAKIIPKTVVQNAYQKQTVVKKDLTQETQPTVSNPVEPLLSEFEQQVVNYHRDGFTVEEIAKKTQKGKTEIELLIKFHA